jgi:hypothetical protein
VLQSAVDAFSPCTSPKTYTAQPDGDYRFVVKDSAGSSASFLFTIDTVAPTVAITNNPANPDPNPSASFSFTANETGTTFQCSFGLSTAAPAFSACTSPANFTGLTSGSTYTFQVKGTDPAGNTSGAQTYTFAVSANSAVTTTAPTQALAGLTTAQAGTSATTTKTGPITASTTAVPVTISWTGTACASGAVSCNIASYHLQESINGLGFSDVTLPSPTATSVTLNLKPSPTNNSTPQVTYRYQVQAVDKAGNLSTFAPGPTFSVPDTDDNFQSSYKGSWSGQNLTGAFSGAVHWSSTASATANPQNPAAVTSYAVVSTLGPDRGKANILVDGQMVATVDLYAPTQQTAQVVWAMNGLAPSQTHSVQVVSTNTRNQASSGTRVDYDAILALK